MTALQDRAAESPSRAPRSPRSPIAASAAWALITLGVVAVWFVFYALVVSAVQHTHDQSVLYGQLREELALATAPLGGDIAPGSPVGLLNLPAAGLHDEVIVEGTSSQDLMMGPGHKRDSPLPGQAGVSLVYGRAKLFGGPFHSLPAVPVGAVITVVTAEGTSEYVVRDVRHAGDPYPPQLAAGGARLTLVTSESSGWRSGWAPARAVYVDADLQGKTFPAPAGRPSFVPTAETAMKADPGALYVLVLWLPLLVLAAVLAVWGYVRWGRWQAWLVGMPIVLGALWGVTQTATRLLPNLM